MPRLEAAVATASAAPPNGPPGCENAFGGLRFALKSALLSNPTYAELVTVVNGYLVTATGLQPLGFGVVEAGSGKTPGGAAPLVVAVATGNPVGLLVSGAAKAYGEASGSETIEGAARRTADEIAEKSEAPPKARLDIGRP
ncbi:MAG: hypothetical protein HC841_03405 [Verrucomicrobiae bacterium]|nr:hypothetical protein [Verrucomicrobiae bacterium]